MSNEDTEMWELHNKEMAEMRERRRLNFEDVLDGLVKRHHKVQQMSLYQFRIDDALDIYPSNKRWHDIKHNRRGDMRVPFPKMVSYIENLLNKNK